MIGTIRAAILHGALCAAVLWTTGGAAKAASAGSEGGWQFNITPYMWLPTLRGDLNYGQPGLKVEPDEILDSLDMGFLLAGEVRKGNWLVVGDVIYLNVSDQQDNAVSLEVEPGVNVDVDADLSLENWIVNLFGGYGAYATERLQVDAVVGVRSFYADTDLKLSADALGARQEFSSSDTIWNVVVGARGKVWAGEHWFIPYHLDLGLGDSDFTWQVEAGIAYAFSWGELLATYRYLSFDQGGEGGIEELTMGGPAFGVGFDF